MYNMLHTSFINTHCALSMYHPAAHSVYTNTSSQCTMVIFSPAAGP